MNKKSQKTDELGNSITSQKSVKVRWNGEQPTMIRKQVNGEKYPIKKGETMQIDEGVARSVRTSYPELEIVGEGVKARIIEEGMKVKGALKKKPEGKLDSKKVAKG